MENPEGLKYSQEHEWVKIDGQTALIGITDYAQEQLGDVVMVELPEVGHEFKKGDTLGVVESVKSVSDIFAPISGKVTEVNQPLMDSPGLVNEDCYGEGWILKIEISDSTEASALMESTDYQKFLDEEA